MTLRDYQQHAVDHAINHLRKCIDPVLIDAPTGSGKSHIIASISDYVFNLTAKHILVLQPDAKLVEQNYNKYSRISPNASIFSASISKCIEHQVIFGTPKSVLNSIDQFKQFNFAMIILDEAHGITPTILSIIETLRGNNLNLRILGVTATSYRLDSGLIYEIDQNGNTVPKNSTKKPFFKRLIYKIEKLELIDRGYLVPPIEAVARKGKEASGYGRKTGYAISEIVERTVDQKGGVILYAANLDHAKEILSSLPKEDSAIISGKITGKERWRLYDSFDKRQFKYFVNVSVLTTGFDAPHVQTIVFLRKTMSVQLFEQMVGRGLRINPPDKDHCDVFDYVGNIEEHYPDRGLLEPPTIKKVYSLSKRVEVICNCPKCGSINQFIIRDELKKLKPDQREKMFDQYGYMLDTKGMPVIHPVFGAVPAHLGRRCQGMSLVSGSYERCSYRWSFKTCKSCGAENDIAARKCIKCREEIVDPNDKILFSTEQRKPRFKEKVVLNVLNWVIYNDITSKSSKRCLKIFFITDQVKFPAWFIKNAYSEEMKSRYNMLLESTDNLENKPTTITVSKNSKGYFDIHAFNEDVS